MTKNKEIESANRQERAQDVANQARQFERRFKVHDDSSPLKETFEATWAGQLQVLGDPKNEVPRSADAIEASAGLLDLALRESVSGHPNPEEARKMSFTARDLFLAVQERLYPEMEPSMEAVPGRLRNIADKWSRALERDDAVGPVILASKAEELEEASYLFKTDPEKAAGSLRRIVTSVSNAFGNTGWEGGALLSPEQRRSVGVVMQDCGTLLRCEELANRSAREKSRASSRAEQPEAKEREERRERQKRVLAGILKNEEEAVKEAGTESNFGRSVSQYVEVLAQKGRSLDQVAELLVKMARRLDELIRAHEKLMTKSSDPTDGGYSASNLAFKEFTAGLGRDYGVPELPKIVEEAQALEKARQEKNRNRQGGRAMILLHFQKTMNDLIGKFKREGLF